MVLDATVGTTAPCSSIAMNTLTTDIHGSERRDMDMRSGQVTAAHFMLKDEHESRLFIH